MGPDNQDYRKMFFKNQGHLEVLTNSTWKAYTPLLTSNERWWVDLFVNHKQAHAQFCGTTFSGTDWGWVVPSLSTHNILMLGKVHQLLKSHKRSVIHPAGVVVFILEILVSLIWLITTLRVLQARIRAFHCCSEELFPKLWNVDAHRQYATSLVRREYRGGNRYSSSRE